MATAGGGNDAGRFFMCQPDHFNIEYVINPWMEGNLGKADHAKAMDQWMTLHSLIERKAKVELITPAAGLPDMVFTANAGLALENSVILSHFAHPERQAEEPLFDKWFQERGFIVKKVPGGIFFEGAGDALFDGGGKRLWAAYGNRTSLFSHHFLAEALNIQVVSLRLVDPRFYHLDTCFLPLPDGSVAWYPGAFDTRSNRVIESLLPEGKRIIVGEEDAARFSANAVVVGDMVIMNCASEKLARDIQSRGLQVEIVDFSEFIKSGGSAKCLTLRLDQSAAAQRATSCAVASREARIEGQLIDSALLSRVCDAIADSGGAFHALDMRLGQKRYEASSAVMEVAAPSEQELETILQRIVKLGARLPMGEALDARLEPAPADGVAPESFYSSTIYHTQVRHGGKWLDVADQRMDSVVLVEAGKA
ncbi:MAG: arginine deiminase-related protein, partial [Nitrospinota bacterium]|nr:arginine deiminase-related protein [Nitrospinota bacterium]